MSATTPNTLAAERTALAWRRTAVAAMGTAALFVNHATLSGWRDSAIAPLCAAAVLMLVAGVSFTRNRSLQHGHWGHGAQVIAATAAAVVSVTALATILAIFYPIAT
ncbi:DUF202 domain-containing protein [Nocardia yamanashiensis]|uniref:DUF202 domain-containing protein n=1 Tax=Nocardia yamanashiensis TaxID=209247 RepID=UPI001E61EE2E|nr:DUF202 domain-containing protein [Nocardia yamanashiensis]UGT44985.1 DUF202 domain-containing protein [Nocardia yamanashiensis]